MNAYEISGPGYRRGPKERPMMRATRSCALTDPRDGKPFAVHAGRTLLALDHPAFSDRSNLAYFEQVDAAAEMRRATAEHRKRREREAETASQPRSQRKSWALPGRESWRLPRRRPWALSNRANLGGHGA